MILRSSGSPLLFIGRQVPMVHGKYIDLLAVDAYGTLHVLELKRKRTPLDVVSQGLDYGSWIERLTHEQVVRSSRTIARAWRSRKPSPSASACHLPTR